MRAVIRGCGHYLPEKILTNDDMSRIVDTSDAWIFSRTGIRQRHFAAEGENSSHLGAKAAKEALTGAGIRASSIDTIIVATTTPDRTFPATACMIQQAVGATNAFCFDISAACAGYLVGLSLVDAYIRSGQARRILLIGAEVFSRIIDMKDRNTCVLFGDGAGAVLFDAEKNDTAGIIKTTLNSAPQYQNILQTSGGVGSTQTAGYIEMTGQEVYRHAVNNLTSSAAGIFKDTEFAVTDIDWLIPHQANVRIIQHVAKTLGLPMDKVIMTVDRHANTSAASIPLALSVGIQEGKIKSGDLILHEALGGGLIWGSSLIRV
ncbi:MAG: ketoacyl-ACP synthase III [Alphaproteobacteria bacterium]|nr:MAG: ketoacyl-ACP synthase III [Alphaproteobacteria bacterium]